MNSAVLVKNKEVGFAQVPIPTPGPNQVLIKVEAAALNPSDVLFMAGHYNIKLNYPYTPGWEGSGTVVSAGAGIYSEWLVGRRVAFMKAQELGEYKHGGAYAEFIVTDTKCCIPLNKDFSFEQAASFVVNPLTAVLMVERCKELKAKTIILTAACSQIARMILRVCKNEGIRVICTVRRPEQVKILKDAGEEFVVDTSVKGYQKELGGLCLKFKPSVCLECVSGNTTGEMLEYMGFNSTLILYGTLSEQKAAGINTVAFIGKKQTIEGFLLNHIIAPYSQFQMLDLIMKVEKMYATELTTVVQKRFGLHQLQEAMAYYKANQTAGKILLVPSLTESPKL